MNEENREEFSRQMDVWVALYKRYFEGEPENASDSKDVSLTFKEQIPPQQMEEYVRNYEKWFLAEPNKEELTEKLFVLKRIKEGWELNLKSLSEIIGYLERVLSQM